MSFCESGWAKALVAPERPASEARTVRFTTRLIWIERKTRRRRWLNLFVELLDWLQGARVSVHLVSRCLIAGMHDGDQMVSLRSGEVFLRDVFLPREIEGTVAGYAALESAIRSDFMDDLMHADAVKN